MISCLLLCPPFQFLFFVAAKIIIFLDLVVNAPIQNLMTKNIAKPARPIRIKSFLHLIEYPIVEITDLYSQGNTVDLQGKKLLTIPFARAIAAKPA